MFKNSLFGSLLLFEQLVLRMHSLKGIYINPDLTESERALDKQLRAKRNELNDDEKRNKQPFRWGIRGDRVIRFANSKQQI